MTRLLAEEGLSYRFEHEQADYDSKTDSSPINTGASSSQNNSASSGKAGSITAHAKHYLVIFDAASRAPQRPSVSTLGGPLEIHFHRAHAAEALEGFIAFSALGKIRSQWLPALLSR